MAEAVRDALLELFRKSGASPFLFVGAGLGRRYLNLATWEQLLRRFAAETPRAYEFYVTQAGRDNYPRLGSEIAVAFRDVWWNSTKYESDRDAAKDLMEDFASPLKVEVSKYLLEECRRLNSSALPDELGILADAKVDGVITTNYDTILETVFPDYEVYRSQDETLFRVSHGVGEIYKIHGCATKPNTLVLTQEDYELFDARNAYLAAKLTTLFLEHPFVFIGYSISDRNVQSVLAAVIRCLPKTELHRLYDRLIFVEYASAAGSGIVNAHSMSIGASLLPVTRVQAASFEEIYHALAETERKIPASVLRRVKDRVYELVRTTDPKGALHVVDLENDSLLKEVDVVVGVGIVSALGAKGYNAVERLDLINDVLGDGNHAYDATAIIQVVLPNLLKRAGAWVPVWGDLKTYTGDTAQIPTAVKNYAQKTLADFRAGNPYAKNTVAYASIAELDSGEPLSRSLYLLPLLPKTALVPTELRAYLLKYRSILSDKHQSGLHSNYIKLVCLLDYLEHR